MNAPEGRVFDLGYRHYDGPREGRGRARKALFVNGVRTCFGLGRGAWAKALPILFLVSVMAPAAVLAVMVGLLGQVFADAADLPGPETYYQIVSLILMMFSAIIAPELLCPDRRDGVISLYLVRPLSSTDYVLGRWLAFFAVSLVFIYAGQVLLIAGLTLGSDDPITYLRENWLHVPRFLAAGLVIGAVTTTIPLAAASFTSRRAYAALAVIGLFVATTVTSGILSEQSCEDPNSVSSGATITITVGVDSDDSNTVCEPLYPGIGTWIGLIDFGGVPIAVSDLIFGIYDEPTSNARPPAPVSMAWWIVVVAVPAFILWSRYRRLAT